MTQILRNITLDLIKLYSEKMEVCERQALLLFPLVVVFIALYLEKGSRAVNAFSVKPRLVSSKTHQGQWVLASSSRVPRQPFDDGRTSSVGNYVQGVHGGKYQFEDAGGATFAGRQFAESLYSSDPNEGVVCNGLMEDNDPIPAWALRMGSATKLGTLDPLQKYPVLFVSSCQAATITITNDERSWEHYFCKLVQVTLGGTILDDLAVWPHQQPADCVVAVSPTKGHLAPRGGSSNLCDPNNPYSDSAQIQIQLANSVLTKGHHHLLLIGTEAETWPYWIQVVDE
jgi:hypothetical protein